MTAQDAQSGLQLRSGPREFRMAGMSAGYRLGSWLLPMLLLAVTVVTTVMMPVRYRLWLPTGFFLFVTLVLLMVWALYRPRMFVVSADGLKIVWAWRSRTIPRQQIVAVEPADKQAVGRLRRWAGAGGFLGLFGICHSQRLGTLDAYVSRKDRFVLVRLAGHRPLLLTPERPEEFLRAVRELIGQ